MECVSISITATQILFAIGIVDLFPQYIKVALFLADESLGMEAKLSLLHSTGHTKQILPLLDTLHSW